MYIYDESMKQTSVSYRAMWPMLGTDGRGLLLAVRTLAVLAVRYCKELYISDGRRLACEHVTGSNRSLMTLKGSN